MGVELAYRLTVYVVSVCVCEMLLARQSCLSTSPRILEGLTLDGLGRTFQDGLNSTRQAKGCLLLKNIEQPYYELIKRLCV